MLEPESPHAKNASRLIAECACLQQVDMDLDYIISILIEVAEEFAQSPAHFRGAEQSLRDAADNLKIAYASCAAGTGPHGDSLLRMEAHLVASGWRTLRAVMRQVGGH